MVALDQLARQAHELGAVLAVSGVMGDELKGDAGVVFAGYGITAPERNWDDYGDLDVRGKVVVVITGEPEGDLFNGAYATNGATTAFSSATASRGFNRTCNPRCPPFRNTRSCASACSSIATRTGRDWPKGLMPPTL